MFSEKKERPGMEPGTGQNRINEGTKLKGDIHSKGFFRVDGVIEGNVDTPSKVVLGKTGIIKGTLTCENADIEGKFEGNLNVSGTLTLRATAHIEGDVLVGKLAVEPGATFNASCAMKGSSKPKQPQTGALANISSEEKEAEQNSPFDRNQRTQKAKAAQSS